MKQHIDTTEAAQMGIAYLMARSQQSCHQPPFEAV
jgi:hypothetical protein